MELFACEIPVAFLDKFLFSDVGVEDASSRRKAELQNNAQQSYPTRMAKVFRKNLSMRVSHDRDKLKAILPPSGLPGEDSGELL
jgi:hypothetical protein